MLFSKSFSHSMKKGKWLGILLALASCNQTLDIKNGEIPNEYLSYAKPYLGTYRGYFDNHSVTLTLSLKGNQLIMKTDQDLISRECGSKIGLLTEISYSDENDKASDVNGAKFAFNPGACSDSVQGRELKVSLDKNDQGSPALTLNLKSRTGFERSCTISGGHPPYTPPREECHYNPVDHYLNGQFEKISR